MTSSQEPRFAEKALLVDGTEYRYFDVSEVPGSEALPVSLKILLENVLRCARTPDEARVFASRIVEAGRDGRSGEEIEFMPGRVLFQDFTGVPVFVDFAAMRDAASDRGADPTLVNPQIPCVLVVDHSVTADVVSCSEAVRENARIEAERNAERFSFLKWSAESFQSVSIVPPGRGICHQLNIERFCTVAMSGAAPDGSLCAYFDTLVGTDSHTPTANGMGVLGWGVGGIEAEAAALGQPITMMVPAVVGLRLTGELRAGVSAMDAALSFAELLRSRGVVGKIVECFGPGVASLTATQRATIANMTPEYGCTATFFPPDAVTLCQLDTFGRTKAERSLARAYLEAQNLLADTATPVFSEIIDFDLGSVEPSLAGPSRPHDRLGVGGLQARFRASLAEHGRHVGDCFDVSFGGKMHALGHGAIGIAAVTSCTTATDPDMMLACGLVARRAVELGCKPVPWVKKVLAPGSHATTELLARAGLLEPLAELGFTTCGWGCMSCIGNSGPLFDPMHRIAGECELVSVLSGNRNFEGRISPDIVQNYLCAPALVVALSLAGTVDIDLEREPLCSGTQGPVMLADLLPDASEVEQLRRSLVSQSLFQGSDDDLFRGDESWSALDASRGETFSWDDASTYVRRPAFLDDALRSDSIAIEDARCLALLGDFITTDHISPAGAIDPSSSAAAYLRAHGVDDADFNTYGARRGNHEVMMRGTFANIRLKNKLVERTGGWTVDPVTGEEATIFDASESARRAHHPLVVIAGKMYGSGSSRDWAAKGTALLGVRAIIAESFERIHRSNLIGMGILPFEFMPGEGAETLGLTGLETFSIGAVSLAQGLPEPMTTSVCARAEDGTITEFSVRVRVDTPTEGAYLASGGILPYVLDGLVSRRAIAHSS